MPLTRVTTNQIEDLSVLEVDLADQSVSLDKLKVDSSSAGPNYVIATDGLGELIIIDPTLLGSTTLAGMDDVDLSTPPSVGQVLTFDGNNWIASTVTGGGGGATQLNDLLDVTVTSPSNGQILQHDGIRFVNTPLSYAQISGSPPIGFASFLSLSDTNTPAIANNFLKWNGSASTIEYVTISASDVSGLAAVATTGNVNDLNDIDTSGATTGSVLKYNGSTWVVATDDTGGGANQLDDLIDVTIASATSGEVLRYNGSTWVDAQLDYSDLSGTPAIPSSVNDLSDVDTTGAVSGSVLKYDGSNWTVATDSAGETNTASNLGAGEGIFGVKSGLDLQFKSLVAGANVSITSTANEITINSTAGGGVASLNDLSDVVLSSPSIGEVLKFNGASWVDTVLDYTEIANTPTLATVATTGNYSDLSGTPSVPVNIEDLANVDVTGVVNGSILKYDGSDWVIGTDNTGGGGGATILNDLTDVTISAAATGEVLRFNGSNWVDAQLDYSDLSGTPTLATVATSGDYNDLTNLPTIPSAINDLSDVDTSGVAAGSILKYNGVNWVIDTDDDSGEVNTASNLGAGEGLFSLKSGVDLRFKSLVAGTNVSFSSDTNTITINATGGGGPTALDDLTDVDTTTTAPSTNDVLTYDGSEWVPQAPGAASTTSERFKLNYATNGDLSSTSGLTSGIASATILSPTGGDVEISFTGHTYPPSSIIFYGYSYTTNEYLIQSTPFSGLNTAKISAGGSSGSPIAFGNFSGAGVSITLTLKESDTGASRDFGTTTEAWVQFIF